MKILLFSDIHLHNFRAYSNVTENGLNSRLVSGLNCIDQITQYVEDNDVELILFGGDLFHERSHVPTDVLNEAHKALERLHDTHVPIVMIPGNHDQRDRSGSQQSLFTFEKYGTVVTEAGWLQDKGKHGIKLFCLPYSMEPKDLLKKIDEDKPTNGYKLFLGHVGIFGATVGSDFVLEHENDPQVEDLLPEEFDFGYLGHFHKHQKLCNNFYYIGATQAINWGDRGDWRGFLVHDTETNTFEKIESVASKFMEIKKIPSNLSKLKGNFVRLLCKISPKPKEIEEVKKVAASFEVIVQEADEETSSIRVDITPSMAYDEILSKFIDSDVSDTDGLDKKYLLELGKKVISEIT